MKSAAPRSKTGESCPSLESRTWKPSAVFRASTQSAWAELLLRVLFRQVWRHSTQLVWPESLLRVLFRQAVCSTIEKPSNPLRVSPQEAAGLIIQGEFLLIDHMAALIEVFHVYEIRRRTRSPI